MNPMLGKKVEFFHHVLRTGTIVRATDDWRYEVEYVLPVTGRRETCVKLWSELKLVSISLAELYAQHRPAFPFHVRGRSLWWTVSCVEQLRDNADYVVAEWREEK